MIRAVLDTNTTVSGVLRGDTPPAGTVRGALEGRFRLVTSPALLAELRRVLVYPRIRRRTGWSDAQVTRFISLLLLVAEVVLPRAVPHVVTDDPADDQVLACAVAGKAGVVVSGDRHLPALRRWRGARIMTAREFLALLG